MEPTLSFKKERQKQLMMKKKKANIRSNKTQTSFTLNADISSQNHFKTSPEALMVQLLLPQPALHLYWISDFPECISK